MLAVLLGLTIGMLALYYAMGWIIAMQVDGTIMVDNPDRPPDSVCQSDSAVSDTSGCTQPRAIEQDVDTQIWRIWHDEATTILVAIPFGWVILGGLLHAGSWLADGEHGIAPSFAIAAWGLVPFLVGGVLIVGLLAVTLEPVRVTPGNQDAALEPLIASIRALKPAQGLVSLGVGVWSAVIWRFGLEQWRGVSDLAAWLVSATLAGGIVIGGLL